MHKTPPPDIGRNIRIQRKQRGLSARNLGRAIGVTQQQINKYETGINRIPADRLYAISISLNVPVDIFYAPEPGLNNNARLRAAITERIAHIRDVPCLQQIHRIIEILDHPASDQSRSHSDQNAGY